MITKTQIKEVIKLIATGYDPDKIILFGSQASGTSNNYSDIDLLIIKDDKLPQRERNRSVRKLLKDLLIPVDVIVKTNQEFQILKNIVGTVVYSANKYGVVVYGK
ncbi:MAG: nucleotidyltransferase domain-containing protein [Oligoflexia bacterium]|nr:nucleotidyltransferase domain-containing protein [Oligoflexia bacterium]